MKLKIVPIVMMMFLVFTPSVLALDYVEYCIDSQMLGKNATLTRTTTVNGVATVKVYEFHQNITCAHGCSESEDKCNPSPFEKSLLIVGILIGVTIVSLALWKVK